MHADGTAYRQTELDAIRKLTADTTINFTAADYRLPQFARWEVNDTDEAIRYSLLVVGTVGVPSSALFLLASRTLREELRARDA